MTAFNYEYSKQRKRGVKPAIAKIRALEAQDKQRESNIKNGYDPEYFIFGGYDKPHIYSKSYIYNPPWENTQNRWIENTELAGLRQTSLKCDGWYVDDYGDIVQAAVWQLPGRNGKPIFVSGYKDFYNEGAALIDFDCFIDDERGAINRANGMAENYADQQREHNAAYQREQEIDELKSNISSELKRGIAIIQDAKRIRKALCETTALRDMLSNALFELRSDIAEMRTKITELENY